MELSGNKTSSQLGLADATHTHDSRYYTETETNTLLAAKANTSHTQAASTITGLATVATSGNYNDLSNKPTIPPAYTLPTATTSTLGGVKVDGSTITISNGVISSSGGSSGNYLPLTGGTLAGDLRLKDASNYGRTLYFGDGNYCYISEPTDDKMYLKSTTMELAPTTSLTTTTQNLYLNGSTQVQINGNIITTGTWTPTCNYIKGATANGTYFRFGNVVVINFMIEGTSTGSGTTASFYIDGLPFTSSSIQHWYSGGGYAAGLYAPAYQGFAGWNIESATNRIYAKSNSATSAAGNRGSSYMCVGSSTSQAVYCSGTIMYKIA